MLRQIKFRAWDKGHNVMRQIQKMSFKNGKMMPYKWNMWFGEETLSEPMQYTGLKDKNRKEIFEGDIIRFTWEEDSCWGKQGTYTAYIRFNRGTFEVVYIGKKYLIEDGNQTGSDGLNYFMDWSEDVEVVGDIYTTPELLKAGE